MRLEPPDGHEAGAGNRRQHDEPALHLDVGPGAPRSSMTWVTPAGTARRIGSPVRAGTDAPCARWARASSTTSRTKRTKDACTGQSLSPTSNATIVAVRPGEEASATSAALVGPHERLRASHVERAGPGDVEPVEAQEAQSWVGRVPRRPRGASTSAPTSTPRHLPSLGPTMRTSRPGTTAGQLR